MVLADGSLPGPSGHIRQHLLHPEIREPDCGNPHLHCSVADLPEDTLKSLGLVNMGFQNNTLQAIGTYRAEA